MNRLSSSAKAARIHQGLSLREVAAVVGKSHVWVMRIENGETVPSRQDRERLSEALGIDLSDMPAREDFEP
jgi:transcriptional regulator with XRE-family HTH domain